MHTQALKDAVRYWLQTYWTLDGGCEVKITDPPGKPIGCMGPWAITIYDVPQSFEGKIGYYPRYGCMVTFSARLVGTPITNLETFLDDRNKGFVAIKDALTGFLHKWRYSILQWSNRLVDAAPIGGIATNMVEAPRPLNVSAPQRRQADWWGEQVGKITTQSGNTDEARAMGLSCDIVYGHALSMQNESPEER